MDIPFPTLNKAWLLVTEPQPLVNTALNNFPISAFTCWNEYKLFVAPGIGDQPEPAFTSHWTDGAR
jgi:hypothetical protein